MNTFKIVRERSPNIMFILRIALIKNTPKSSFTKVQTKTKKMLFIINEAQTLRKPKFLQFKVNNDEFILIYSSCVIHVATFSPHRSRIYTYLNELLSISQEIPIHRTFNAFANTPLYRSRRVSFVIRGFMDSKQKAPHAHLQCVIPASPAMYN